MVDTESLGTADRGGYEWTTAETPHTHAYLNPIIRQMLVSVNAHSLLDLGCGNGAMAATFASEGYDVVGCDPVPAAIEYARRAAPHVRFEVAGVYDDPLVVGLEAFDAVVSAEVIEHLMKPSALIQFAHSALKPGGHLIVTTPYYGYAKNVAVAATGRWDGAHNVFWDYGHVKFFSRKSLTTLLEQNGFVVQQFHGAGRVPYLWKSMIVMAQKRTMA